MSGPVTLPILPSADFDRTATFYARLGFAEARRWGDEYLILRHGAPIELHFFSSPSTEPAGNDHGCYVRFASGAEVRALHRSWAGAGPSALEDTDYGLTEFAVHDPDGNQLRVGGPTER